MTKSSVEGVTTQKALSKPLCVDLDGTLLRVDTLVESIFVLIKNNFLNLFLLPFWLFGGKAYFKHRVAERTELDVSLLPRNEKFVTFLVEQHELGTRLVLATAANEKIAGAVASEFGIFEDVIASDAQNNLSGRRKLTRLQERYGEKGFDYAGNARVDVQIWQHANHAIAVNFEEGARKAAERHGIKLQVFDGPRRASVLVYLRALRIHQWLKNLLIFVPLVMAHRLDEPNLLVQAFMAFVAFGLCASSVYLLNDLLDMPEDRQHPSKKKRPFASGELPAIHGIFLIPVLLGGAILLAFLLPQKFALVLLGYYMVTLAYSFRLKQAALVDVLTLAGLYTIRIIAGAAAVAVVLSFWILAFSMFLFLSLALAKRFTELQILDAKGKDEAAGRGYSSSDLEILSQFGSSSAFMSVLVLALYINSEAVAVTYSRPQAIWLLCPLLLYLVSRIWLLARRGELHEDPVVFVIMDRRSQILALGGALLLWLAI